MKLPILLADDHEIGRRGLCSLLQKREGWEVCGEASDGREAVDMAKQLKPDAVIVDIGMPCLNGLDTTRQVLQLDPNRRARSRGCSRSLAEQANALHSAGNRLGAGGFPREGACHKPE
jgi:DNA-binding NarL/FixJ family response regulator